MCNRVCPKSCSKMVETSSNQLNRARISRHHLIGCKQCEPFAGGLCHQHSVERIVMNRRQCGQGQTMPPVHRQFFITIGQEPCPQNGCVHLKIGPLESTFDRDLPQAHHTEPQRVTPQPGPAPLRPTGSGFCPTVRQPARLYGERRG